MITHKGGYTLYEGELPPSAPHGNPFNKQPIGLIGTAIMATRAVFGFFR